MLNYISEIISRADVYSEPISFNIKGNTNFKTWVGGIISLIVYAFFFMFAIFLMIEMINKSDQNVISFENSNLAQQGQIRLVHSIKENQPLLEINPTNFFFWGLEINTLGKDINLAELQKIVHVEANKVTVKPKESSKETKEPYTLIDCHSKYSVDDWIIENTSAVICFDEITEIIEGEASSETFIFTEMIVKECTEGPNPQNCYPDSERLNKRNNTFFVLNSSFAFINSDITGNEVPVNWLDKHYYFGLPAHLTQVFELSLAKNLFRSEENLIVPSMNVHEETFVSIKAENTYTKPMNGNFLEIRIKQSFTPLQYERSYRNFLEVLSQVGGVWSIMYALGATLAFKVNTRLLIVNVANSLFSLIMPEHELIDKENYYYQLEEFGDEGRNNLIKHGSKTIIEAKMCIEYYKYERFEHIDLELTEALIDVLTFGKFNSNIKKKKLLDIASEEIMEKMDLSKIFLFSLQMKSITKLLLKEKSPLLKLFTDYLCTENAGQIAKTNKQNEKNKNMNKDELSKVKEHSFLTGIRGLSNKPVIYDKVDLSITKAFKIPHNWFESYFVMKCNQLKDVEGITSDSIYYEQDN